MGSAQCTQCQPCVFGKLHWRSVSSSPGGRCFLQLPQWSFPTTALLSSVGCGTWGYREHGFRDYGPGLTSTCALPYSQPACVSCPRLSSCCHVLFRAASHQKYSRPPGTKDSRVQTASLSSKTERLKATASRCVPLPIFPSVWSNTHLGTHVQNGDRSLEESINTLFCLFNREKKKSIFLAKNQSPKKSETIWQKSC